jgi:hypothetical protein
MKRLRKLLMILAVPAAVLYGLKEIGGSPIYKGDESGLAVKVEQNPAKLVVTNDLGDATCVLRLKLSMNAPAYKALLANGTPLAVHSVVEEGESGWIELTDTSPANDKFKWPSGTGIYIFPQSVSTYNLKVEDWRLFRTDKSPDSMGRAKWRNRGFIVAIVCLFLALIGGALEAADRLKEKPAEALTPQRLVEAMIQNVSGPSDEKTTAMRAMLTKLVFQGIGSPDVLVGVPGTEVEKQALLLTAVRKLKEQFVFYQQELQRLSARLEAPPPHARP